MVASWVALEAVQQRNSNPFALPAGGEHMRRTLRPAVGHNLFDTAGVRTTYGSPMFSDNVPAEDAAAVRLARDAGAILIGKTQTHEFAWGITSVNDLMGTSRNPWDLERISGGSSGGSAVALAVHLVPLALGSDTGGSIRVPSGFCGTVGLKPTYGRVSAAGVFPLAPSLDHPGPMARTPADAGLLLEVITNGAHGDPAAAGAPRAPDPPRACPDCASACAQTFTWSRSRPPIRARSMPRRVCWSSSAPS